MPQFSGSYSPKTVSQTTIPAPGNHQIGMSVVTGEQQSPDSGWNGATQTMWGILDTVEGNGTIRGYFRNVHANGDIDYGTTEGTVTMSGTDTTMTGTWCFTGGTGKFAKITGNGVFKGKQTSPTDSLEEWSGSYSLG
jgi:hypothetical protein